MGASTSADGVNARWIAPNKIEAPEGTTYARTDDGFEIEMYPDGTKIQRNPDGSVLEKHPNGTIVQTSPEGIRLEKVIFLETLPPSNP